jgi:hypothetical protein
MAAVSLSNALVGAEPVMEGNVEPLSPRIFALHNPASQPVPWEQLRDFLLKDDSNQHAYKEGVYDCKHFSLELYRRSQEQRISCRITLVIFAESKVGHSVVCFPTTDKGKIFVDFTPIVSGTGKQRPAKNLSLLDTGRLRIQVPLEQVPVNFTNNVAFFADYLSRQASLVDAAELLRQSQSDLSELNGRIAAIKGIPKPSKAKSRELAALDKQYQEMYGRHLDASRIYDAYLHDGTSPFDTKQRMTVVNLVTY